MTFIMDIHVPENLSSGKNIYLKPGSMHLLLKKNTTLRWRISGADPTGHVINSFLHSPPLAPGVHQVVMSIGGFYRDMPRIELFVDGALVDEIDNHPVMILGIWSSVANAVLGDSGIAITNSRFHTIKLWPDEW